MILKWSTGQDFEAKIWSRFRSWILVKNLKLKFGQHFEASVWSRFWCWSLVEILKLNFDQFVIRSKSRYFSESPQPLLGLLCLCFNRWSTRLPLKVRTLRTTFGWRVIKISHEIFRVFSTVLPIFSTKNKNVVQPTNLLSWNCSGSFSFFGNNYIIKLPFVIFWKKTHVSFCLIANAKRVPLHSSFQSCQNDSPDRSESAFPQGQGRASAAWWWN